MPRSPCSEPEVEEGKDWQDSALVEVEQPDLQALHLVCEGDEPELEPGKRRRAGQDRDLDARALAGEGRESRDLRTAESALDGIAEEGGLDTGAVFVYLVGH